MKLPLAILVLAKNEAKVIEDCLRPWKNVASEIIVLDSSTDATPKLAKKCGARVIRGQIDGDFASARNRLLAMTQAEWIFCLDADQTVSRTDIKKLGRLLSDRHVDAYRLPTRHYTDDYNLLGGWKKNDGAYPAEERRAGTSGYFLNQRYLLFRNHRGIRYEYPIHESILPFLRREKLKIKNTSVTIHHREFEKGEGHHLKKHRSYLKMERKLLLTMSPSSPCYAPLLRCMICDVISTGGDLKEAEKLTRRLVRACPDVEAFSLSARVAWLQGKHNLALRYLGKALEIQNSADTLCLLGWLKLDMKELSSAEQFLSRALRVRENHPVGHFLKGSLAFEKNDRLGAISSFKKALRAHPGYRQAAQRLTEIQNG